MADRYDYVHGKLSEDAVLSSPFAQLATWLEQARLEKVVEPTAMCLSTVGPDARPSSRMVLLRGLDDRGLTFFTNYRSRKGRELDANPYACLNLWWGNLERQVRIEGVISMVSEEESDTYWMERPVESRLASAASPQSQVLSNRRELEEMVLALRQELGGEVPRPRHWGGYRLTPDRFEFWQGGPARLHDRLRYRLVDGAWIIERLAP